MKILPTNFLTNYNKFYFSGIQSKNNHFLQKNEEKTEQLPQLDAITSRVYYKFVNNNQISFGEKSDNNADKKAEELQILEELKKAVLSGTLVSEFCRENGYKRIETLLIKYKEKAEEIKQIRKEQQQKLYKKILKNYQAGGNVTKFCQENGILPSTYYTGLKFYGISMNRPRRSFTKEESEKLNEKVLKNYQEKGNIKKFCEENGIQPPDYYYRLRVYYGINFDKKRKSFTKEESEKLNEKILENHNKGGNVKKFCQKYDIHTDTYTTRLRKLGIHSKEEQEKKQKELDEKILKNHEAGGDVNQFCQKNKIAVSTYKKHLIKLGLAPQKTIKKKLTPQERTNIKEKILKNHKEGGNIKEFCEKNGIRQRYYYSCLEEQGISLQKERKKQRKKLLEKILKNHNENGDAKQFCKKYNISYDTYKYYLRTAGITLIQKPQPLTPDEIEELNKQILENHKNRGNIKAFCQEHKISTATYYKRLENLDINAEKDEQNGENQI